MNKPILDPCCGSRMFHFDKQNPQVLFADIRHESHILCDDRILNIAPDVQMDFRDMPFADGSFHHVVFDPPHLIHAGKKSWLALKYGKLEQSWKEDLAKGFSECWRVLASNGTLAFKWNEYQIKTSEILRLTEHQPIYTQRMGRHMKTHWIVFFKAEQS